MSPYDLTTLAAVKAWLGLPSASGPNDPTLAALVTAASRAIHAALGRPSLLPQAYTETLDLETRRVYLRQWPVAAGERGAVARHRRPARSEPRPGGLDSATSCKPGDAAPPGRPQALDLFGAFHRPGRQSLVVSYRAGYAVPSETQTVADRRAVSVDCARALRAVGERPRRRLCRDRRGA